MTVAERRQVFETVCEYVDFELPGWQWVLRKKAEGGFFANVISPGCYAWDKEKGLYVTDYDGEGCRMVSAEAGTAAEALMAAALGAVEIVERDEAKIRGKLETAVR